MKMGINLILYIFICILCSLTLLSPDNPMINILYNCLSGWYIFTLFLDVITITILACIGEQINSPIIRDEVQSMIKKEETLYTNIYIFTNITIGILLLFCNFYILFTLFAISKFLTLFTFWYVKYLCEEDK